MNVSSVFINKISQRVPGKQDVTCANVAMVFIQLIMTVYSMEPSLRLLTQNTWRTQVKFGHKYLAACSVHPDVKSVKALNHVWLHIIGHLGNINAFFIEGTLISLSNDSRITLLVFSVTCAFCTVILIIYMFQHRKLKVFKVASPIFLSITLLGCATMYLEVCS